jgi:hypothetical protein
MTYFNRSILASLPIVSLLFVAGCGPSSSHGNPADLDAYLAQFADALCNLDVSCGSMPDVATCKATLRLDSTEIATVRADIASGKAHYDAAMAGACMDYVKRIYGGPCTRSALASVDTTAGDEVCSKVIVGSVADGGACFSAAECASANCAEADTTCLRSRACCAGTCAAKPTPIPVGGDCSALQPGQSCAAGSSCFSTGSAGSSTCQVPSKVAGTSCTSTLECASPLFCARDSSSATGTCQPSGATGAACNATATYGACDDLRDYCDPTTAKCTRRGAAGAACDAAAGTCIGYTSCLGGTCVAMSPERGACNTTDGPTCLGDLECSSQTFTCGFPDFVSTPCN